MPTRFEDVLICGGNLLEIMSTSASARTASRREIPTRNIDGAAVHREETSRIGLARERPSTSPTAPQARATDQVRFELCYLDMDPNLKCVTLWREPNIWPSSRAGTCSTTPPRTTSRLANQETSYSEDENIMHISYESGELEDPAYPGVVTEYPGLVLKKKTQDLMDTPDEPCRLEIDFDNGAPSLFASTAAWRVTNATGGTL